MCCDIRSTSITLASASFLSASADSFLASSTCVWATCMFVLTEMDACSAPGQTGYKNMLRQISGTKITLKLSQVHTKKMCSLRSYSCPSSPVGFTQRPIEWRQMVHKPSKVKYWHRMNENSNTQNTIKSSEEVIQSRKLLFISTGTVEKWLDLTTFHPTAIKSFSHPPDAYAASAAVSHNFTALPQVDSKRNHSSRLSFTCEKQDKPKSNQMLSKCQCFVHVCCCTTTTNLCTLANDQLPDCILFCWR